MQVLFYHLGRSQIVTYLLVSGVFFQDEVVLQILQFGLVDLQQTIQIGQCPLLFGQFDVLHRLSGRES